MKKMKTYRLEEEVLAQLDYLLEFYQKQNDEQAAFKKKISYADILELLIKRDYERLREE